jgi:hypothetical protein
MDVDLILQQRVDCNSQRPTRVFFRCAEQNIAAVRAAVC